MQEHFQIFARYNAWANQRLYTAADKLTQGEIEQERPAAYFDSILGTLNHILAADRFWLDWIERRAEARKAGKSEYYADFAILRGARQDEDRRLIGLVDRFLPQHYDTPIAYRNTRGEAFQLPLSQVLAHLFNHQTHHRGQAHALIKDAGQKPPPLDLVYFLRAF